MNFLILFHLTFLLIAARLHIVSGETFPQCENLSSGSFIGGTKGCQSYIYCDGDDSYEGFCPSQLLFNTKDGSCAAAGDVDCTDDEEPATTTTTTTTTRTTPTTTVTTTTSTTEDVTEAVNPEVDPETEFVFPTDEQPVIADVQTTQSPAITTAIITSGGDSTSRPTQVCPASDNPGEVIFLPSDVSCSEYFVCYHGTPVPMYCSGRLYFDYVTSKCELPERVNCKTGSPTTPNPKKECTANTFDYFPYAKNCNYFYKCINGFLSLQQCPIGFGWSEDMKLCLKLEQGRCPVRAADLQQSQVWLNNVFKMY